MALKEHIDMLDKDRTLLRRLRAASLATAQEITWTAAGRRLMASLPKHLSHSDPPRSAQPMTTSAQLHLRHDAAMSLTIEREMRPSEAPCLRPAVTLLWRMGPIAPQHGIYSQLSIAESILRIGASSARARI